jgi:hypothetical protein
MGRYTNSGEVNEGEKGLGIQEWGWCCILAASANFTY